MNRDSDILRRLYSARAAIAYAISLDGEVYGPLLDRIEREIAAHHKGIDIIGRAILILDEPDVRRIIGRTAGRREQKQNVATLDGGVRRCCTFAPAAQNRKPSEFN